MGFFDVAKIFHPAAGALGLGDKSHRPGAKFLGRLANKERQAQLDRVMKDYENIPHMINDAYTKSAQQAGTYANTPEFLAGLQSEVEAGARGARVAEAARINALRKDLDNKFKGGSMTKGADGWKSGYEEFKPDGFDQTQAGATEQALLNPPTPEPEPEAEIREAPTGVINPEMKPKRVPRPTAPKNFLRTSRRKDALSREV